MQVVTLKLTPSEVALADWLARHRQKANRSAVLRDALLAHAFTHEAPEKLQRAAVKERSLIKEPLFDASVYAEAEKGRAKKASSVLPAAGKAVSHATRAPRKKKGS